MIRNENRDGSPLSEAASGPPRPTGLIPVFFRAAIPLVLLASGIASLVYGVGHHSADVSVEQEIEIDLAPPPGIEPPGWEGFGPPGFGPPGEGFDPAGPAFGDPALAGMPPWLGPPPELSKVKEKFILTENASELSLIREITFGGVRRLSSGVLWRTYSGAPPSLCPT
jgi:hypothetical protein